MIVCHRNEIDIHCLKSFFLLFFVFVFSSAFGFFLLKGYRNGTSVSEDSTMCKTTLYCPGTDPMSNRENQPQSYAIPAPIMLSPNHQSGNAGSIFSSDLERKPLDFTPDHIQCLCEALQQKGDIEKLAMLLCNLPRNELVRANESILRYVRSETVSTGIILN